MTPSLRKLLYVAPVFVAVGIARAWGPYTGPICQPPPPVSPPTGLTMPGTQPAQSPFPTPPATVQGVPRLPVPAQEPMPPSLPQPPATQAYTPAAFATPGWNLSIVDGKL